MSFRRPPRHFPRFRRFAPDPRREWSRETAGATIGSFLPREPRESFQRAKVIFERAALSETSDCKGFVVNLFAIIRIYGRMDGRPIAVRDFLRVTRRGSFRFGKLLLGFASRRISRDNARKEGRKDDGYRLCPENDRSERNSRPRDPSNGFRRSSGRAVTSGATIPAGSSAFTRAPFSRWNGIQFRKLQPGRDKLKTDARAIRAGANKTIRRFAFPGKIIISRTAATWSASLGIITLN